MFCKECGTENLNTDVTCKKCNFVINKNLPLNGSEKVKILSYFSILIATLFFGVLPILLIFVSIYIMRKDKKYNQLELMQKLFIIYFSLVSIGWIIFAFNVSVKDTGIVISIILAVLSLLMIIVSDILFFDILKKHEQWIIENGLFADSKNEKSFIEKTTEKIQSIKKEPINTANELLKWAELKERGLISEDEFQKAKEKIFEGKL